MSKNVKIYDEVVSIIQSRTPTLTDNVSDLLKDPDINQHDRSIIVTEVLNLLTSDHETTVSGLHMMLHLVWERLNTGHWAQVWPGWRKLYGLLSVARVLCVSALASQIYNCDTDTGVLRDLVKMCDMGILLGGPDIMGGLLEQIAQRLTEHIASISNISDCDKQPETKRLKLSSDFYKLSDHSLKLNRPLGDIQVLDNPSILEFVSRCMIPRVVTKLTGSMTDWPALSSWSTSRLVNLSGPRTVPVEIGGRYTDDDWTQQLMTVDQFVEQFMSSDSSGRIGYLAQHQLLDQVPALRKDIITPDFCYTGDSEQEPEINVWIGPGGTVSPAHTDKKHNVLCQVVGYKYVALFYPDQNEYMYPDPNPMFNNTSQMDLDCPDSEQFPGVSQLEGHHTILGPGEMLYIPPLMWHYVRSLEQSFSVSFWWE